MTRASSTSQSSCVECGAGKRIGSCGPVTVAGFFEKNAGHSGISTGSGPEAPPAAEALPLLEVRRVVPADAEHVAAWARDRRVEPRRRERRAAAGAARSVADAPPEVHATLDEPLDVIGGTGEEGRDRDDRAVARDDPGAGPARARVGDDPHGIVGAGRSSGHAA